MLLKHAINDEMPVVKVTNHPMGGKHYVYTFKNGYGVSVVPEYDITETLSNDVGKMKPIKGIFECAVLFNHELCYDTHITDDVVRRCNQPQVHDILQKVQRL